MLRVNTPAIVHDLIEDEVIIVHLERGFYYSLSGTSALVWRALDKRYSPEQISTVLFSLSENTDVSRFILDLQQDDLVVIDDSLQPATDLEELRTLLSVSGKDALKLNRYTDMQEFLLLDPIHDVGENGWPHKE